MNNSANILQIQMGSIYVKYMYSYILDTASVKVKTRLKITTESSFSTPQDRRERKDSKQVG